MTACTNRSSSGVSVGRRSSMTNEPERRLVVELVGDVRNRAGHRGHGDAAPHGPIDLLEWSAVDSDAVTAPTAPGGAGHVHVPALPSRMAHAAAAERGRAATPDRPPSPTSCGSLPEFSPRNEDGWPQPAVCRAGSWACCPGKLGCPPRWATALPRAGLPSRLYSAQHVRPARAQARAKVEATTATPAGAYWALTAPGRRD